MSRYYFSVCRRSFFKVFLLLFFGLVNVVEFSWILDLNSVPVCIQTSFSAFYSVPYWYFIGPIFNSFLISSLCSWCPTMCNLQLILDIPFEREDKREDIILLHPDRILSACYGCSCFKTSSQKCSWTKVKNPLPLVLSKPWKHSCVLY
jgi:hypothetical protein